MKRIGLAIIRLIVGGLFIFSGLVKLNDPHGTAIKLAEYFQVFSEDFSEFFLVFVPASMFFSVLLSSLEVVLGVAVLVNFRMKITSWILLLLILFFTFLTFYSAYFDKVKDCGCFGDAIPLTPWESFSKDLILTVLILVIFYFRKSLESVFAPMKSYMVVGGTAVIALIIAFVAIEHLPFIDFRPYAVGENIPKNMTLPEDAKPTIMQVNYTLKNKNTGETKVMSDKEYMDTKIWKDTNWAYVSASEPILIQEGDKPKIEAFMYNTPNGDETQDLFEGNVLLVASYLIEKADMDNFEEIASLAKGLENNDIKLRFASANSFEDMQEINSKYGTKFQVGNIDPKAIKAMIRSNPGILLIKNGTVKGKWHHNDTPEVEDIKELL